MQKKADFEFHANRADRACSLFKNIQAVKRMITNKTSLNVLKIQVNIFSIY